MKISSDSFGSRSGFSVGDVVCWTNIGKKMTGVISSLKTMPVGGRNVIFASVYCFETKLNCDVISLNLKILSKSDANQQEN
tara:strand:- start:379 stop:621 length:243 start_codon:yes stop_codon:yes gene_type:complete